MNLIYDKKKEIKTILICTLIYLIGFFILEKINFSDYIYTDSWIDDHIPFIDIFVIPYVLWFAYIVIGFVYFLVHDSKGFYRTCFYLFVGMYICLFVYLFFPNAQGLRVSLDLNDPLQKILSFIYRHDTSTNVCPSIHVYNSIMMYISLRKNDKFKQNKKVNISVFILTILICLSTFFTKQHAFMDGVYAIGLCIFVYYLEIYYQKEKYKLVEFKENVLKNITKKIS